MYFGVLLHNARENEICIMVHNLETEIEAEDYCHQLRLQNLPAFTFKHKERHKSMDAERCRSCHKAINTLIQQGRRV